MCFVFIWEQTATCATYSINWLVFITELKSVYSAVRTGSLNKAVCASYLIVLIHYTYAHCTGAVVITFNNGFSLSAQQTLDGQGLLIIRGLTITLGRTPLDGWSDRRRDFYLTTHNTHKKQTSKLPAGFEPVIPAIERLQTHASEGAATGIGFSTAMC